MRYKLIVFDIDGTITRHISSWRYIHERLGLWKNRAFRYQDDFLSGKISYRRFCELDAAHWKGIPERRMRKIFEGVRYSKNAVKSVSNLRDLGFKLAAVSTGLQFMADRVRDELRFDYAISNRLNCRSGRLTGGVKVNIEHGSKHTILAKICKKFKIKPGEVIAVGDSEGDVPLAASSGYSIAFNCTSKRLAKTADYNCRTADFDEVYKKILSVSHE